MARRYKRSNRSRDVFPQRVAASLVAIVVLVATMGIWTLFAEAGSSSPASARTSDSSAGSTRPRALRDQSAASPAGRSAEAAATDPPIAANGPSAPPRTASAVESGATSRPRVTSAPGTDNTPDTATSPASSASIARPAPAGNTRARASIANAEGLGHFEAGDYQRAVARFNDAVNAAPQSAEYRNNYGWALFRAGRLADAQRELETTLRLDPARAVVHANLGELWLARGDTTRAVTEYRRFLDKNTDRRQARAARDRLREISPRRGDLPPRP